MKKTQKKLVGFVALLFVVAMTVFAAFLPNPGALATKSSVTDKIVVRVVATTPNVTITGPESGTTFVKPDQTITYTYENVETVVVTLEYTDPDGNTITKTLETLNPGGQPGSSNIPINLYDDYGFGDFVIKVVGTGSDGVTDEDTIKFSYVPVTGEANQDKDTGKVTVDLDYDETNDDIDHIEINVYDKDGNKIVPMSPVKVPKPKKQTELPFEKYNLPDGIYTIEIIAYDTNGEPIRPSHITKLNYKAPVIPVPGTGGDAPNTGGLFAGLNISQSDYVITGLILFFIIGIFSVIFIAKHREDKKRR